MFIEDSDVIVLKVIERNLCRAELTVIAFSDGDRVVVRGLISVRWLSIVLPGWILIEV